MNGASTANGAMVTSRNSTTLPRAWVTEVLKKIVPARETMTKASPAPAAAVSSMSVDSPVRPAPDALVTPVDQPPVQRVPVPDRAGGGAGRAARPAQRLRHPHVPSILGSWRYGELTSPQPMGNRASTVRNERKLVTVSTTRIRTREPDQVCAEAVDLARSAAVATAVPFGVGDHLAWRPRATVS